MVEVQELSHKVHKIHEPTWRNKKHAAQFLSTLETYTLGDGVLVHAIPPTWSWRNLRVELRA